MALNRPRTAEELRGTLAEADSQIDRLSDLLDAALTLARADSGQLQEHFTALNLSELLTDLVETSAPYAQEERGQALACDITPDLWVRGDRDHLTRLFLNLLDNAMQYTPGGGVIRVLAAATREQLTVTVEDTGSGIAPEDLPHVFDRFYRADKARSGGSHPPARHAGLGLSIAQVIAHAHGGEITVESVLGQGSRFIVRLPRTEKD